jgi:uncharacterized membrane protein YccC
MTQLRRPSRAELQIAVLECIIVGAACVLAYWLVTLTEPHIYPRARSATQIGALWAVISVVFVLRDSYEKSTAAAVSRMAATSVSFVLCLVFLPFHIWALGLLVGASALAVILLGRPGDAVSAGISSAVVMIATTLDPHHAWQQPILRFADTVAGVAVGVVAAWLGLRILRPRLPPGQSQGQGQDGAAATE